MKSKNVFLVITTLLFAVIIFFSDIILFLFFICFALLFYINKICQFYISNYIKNRNIDFMKDSRRNFDYLILGIPFNTGDMLDGKTFLDFSNSNASLFSTYLYLIHFCSYLRDDGKGVVVINCKHMKDSISVSLIDLCFYHLVVKMQLGVSNYNMMRRFPVFFLLKRISGEQYVNDHKISNLGQSIFDFCRERNLRLIFI